MSVQWDLTAVGDLAADLVMVAPEAPPTPGREVLVGDVHLTLGGSTGILAAAAARLGTRVRMVGKVGDDPIGRFVLEELRSAGVDPSFVTVDASLKTAVTVALAAPPDRSLVTYAGTIAELRLVDVPDEALRDTRHVHVSSYFLQRALQADVPELFRRARANGATTSLDTGDDPDDAWDAGIWEALAEADVFFPNEREAERLGGVALLAARVPTLVAKLGAAGARVLRGGSELSVGAFPVDAIDATGAGDVFAAGYLSGYLRGLEPQSCLRRAAAAGALATTWPGGQGPGLTEQAVERVERG